MQDLMKQIVEMDRKAREITDSAQKEKISSEKKVSKRREEIRTEYLERARRRITESEPKEREAAEAEWEKKDARNAELIKRLDDLYREKGEQWVSQITERVLGGLS